MINTHLESTLNQIVTNQFSKHVISINSQTSTLHGGTVGQVSLVSGSAILQDGTNQLFKYVLKEQKKWQRPADPDSWRREYDLFTSNFDQFFSEEFYWPTALATTFDDQKTEIWMEYIEGVSGNQLTLEMLEKASFELGKFQSKLLKDEKLLHPFSCFLPKDFMENDFNLWHKQSYSYEYLCSDKCRIPSHVKEWVKNHYQTANHSIEYEFLRSDACDLDPHLKQMIIDLDYRKEDVFSDIHQLPVVICHRDFWIENIFYDQGKIVVLDWDCAGYGFLGEDIASLIVDETDVMMQPEYFLKLTTAYNHGLSQYSPLTWIDPRHIYEMMLIKFGYRLVQSYMFTSTVDVKEDCAERLTMLYQIGQSLDK